MKLRVPHCVAEYKNGRRLSSPAASGCSPPLNCIYAAVHSWFRTAGEGVKFHCLCRPSCNSWSQRRTPANELSSSYYGHLCWVGAHAHTHTFRSSPYRCPDCGAEAPCRGAGEAYRAGRCGLVHATKKCRRMSSAKSPTNP